MKLILFSVLFILAITLNGQSLIQYQGMQYEVIESNNFRIARNGVYVELYLIRHGLSSGFFSINYERLIGRKGRANLRIGVYPDFNGSISFPFTISWLTKPLNNHHFEFGVGIVYRIEHYYNAPTSYQGKEYFHYPTAIMFPLMYRYQKYRYHKNKGWFFRGGVNLFISMPIAPLPAVSVGYKF